MVAESRATLKRKITVRIDQTIYNGAGNEFSAPLYANVLRLLRQEVAKKHTAEKSFVLVDGFVLYNFYFIVFP